MAIKKVIMMVRIEDDLDRPYHMACQTACKTSATVSNITYED